MRVVGGAIDRIDQPEPLVRPAARRSRSPRSRCRGLGKRDWSASRIRRSEAMSASVTMSKCPVFCRIESAVSPRRQVVQQQFSGLLGQGDGEFTRVQMKAPLEWTKDERPKTKVHVQWSILLPHSSFVVRRSPVPRSPARIRFCRAWVRCRGPAVSASRLTRRRRDSRSRGQDGRRRRKAAGAGETLQVGFRHIDQRADRRKRPSK